MTALIITLRYLHIIAACLLFGGVLFLRVILPAGMKELEPEKATAVLLRCRRVFKMVTHTCVLFILVSGVYNVIRLWPQYGALGPGVGHGLIGLHMLLGLAVIVILFWLLAPKTTVPAAHKSWMLIAVVLFFVLVLAASSVKTLREANGMKTQTTTEAK